MELGFQLCSDPMTILGYGTDDEKNEKWIYAFIQDVNANCPFQSLNSCLLILFSILLIIKSVEIVECLNSINIATNKFYVNT